MKGSFFGLGGSSGKQAGKPPLDEDLNDEILVLAHYLHAIPGVEFWSGDIGELGWWVKFRIDPKTPASWHVVMELGHILNYFALSDPLPTVFKPVAPPPQGNGAGLADVAWVIECGDPDFSPTECASILGQWGPDPAADPAAWIRFRND